MKVLPIIGILIISLVLGLVVRLLIKKRPKVEVATWWFLVIFWLVFLIYSLVLTLQEETPLFAKHQRANECFVISSTIFLIIGITLLRKSIKLSKK